MAESGPPGDQQQHQAADDDRPSLSNEATQLREGSSLPPGPDDPLIGKVVASRYRVLQLIGQGGMGRVYKAVHVNMHKNVALKILRPEMTSVRGVLARFEREAVAAGRINHPNVAAATDFGRMDSDGAFYLALEFVDGRSLRKELKKGPFDVSRVLDVAGQICEGLVAAHLQGVVHRDLKPDNIMLVDDHRRDVVKILDFGIAKFSDAEPDAGEHQTRYGVVMGTPRYMSPEQATGSPVDHRTDLYSLGVILYEMLSGRAPFVASGVNAVLSQQLISEPPPLPPSVGPALTQLCRKLLAPEMQNRPSSAAEVLEMLQAARLGTTPGATGARLSRVGSFLKGAAQRSSGILGPALVRVWKNAKERLPWLSVFERRINVGRYAVSLGALTLCGTLVVALALGARLLRREQTPAPSDSTRGELATTKPPESAPQPLPDGASREELEDLLAIPVYKRDKRQWLTIAAAHAQFEEWKQSVSAYRNALQLEPSLKEDYELVQRLRDLAELHEVYEAVSNVALNLLGAPGIDLMYDLWQETRNDESKSLIAANALKNLGIFRLRSASPALRVALALQFAKPEECEEINKTLSDALKHADERAVPEMEKLRVTTGCGVSKKRDCYPCLRERSADLETAIRLAKGRKSPRFDGKKYVPGWRG